MFFNNCCPLFLNLDPPNSLRKARFSIVTRLRFLPHLHVSWWDQNQLSQFGKECFLEQCSYNPFIIAHWHLQCTHYISIKISPQYPPQHFCLFLLNICVPRTSWCPYNQSVSLPLLPLSMRVTPLPPSTLAPNHFLWKAAGLTRGKITDKHYPPSPRGSHPIPALGEP